MEVMTFMFAADGMSTNISWQEDASHIAAIYAHKMELDS
jgi:hypothetical protein